MKTNLFFKPIAVMMMAAFVSACSQDNLNMQDVEGKKVLTVNVTESGFNATGEGSRAIDEDYSTTFEKDDKIGIIIVDADSKGLIQKTYITNNGTSWDGTVYYYENADYLAYYPYDENISDVKSLDEVKEYFSENKFSWNQSTKEAYRNSDLMIAEVTKDKIAENSPLNFTFTHANAMVEFKIPYYSYTTAATADAEDGTATASTATEGYEYAVPVNLILEMTGEEAEFSPYQMAVGKYRVIIPAGTEKSFTGKFTDAKDNIPVNINATVDALTANNAKVYNVSYTGSESITKVTRPIEPGDYFYGDGLIVPNDFKYIPDGCIGVVFSTETKSETAIDGNTVCKNGYVMALVDATGNTNKVDAWDYNWGINNLSIENLHVNEVESFDFSKLPPVITDEESGLYNTNLIETSGNYSSANSYIQHAINTFGAEDNYTSKYAAPENTTGWFLPSVSQFVQIIKNLGVEDGGSFSEGSLDANDVPKANYNGTQKIYIQAPFTEINEILKKAGGSITVGAKTYWTSSVAFYETGEPAETYAPLYFNYSSNGKGDFVAKTLIDEKGDKRRVRLILAF